MRLAVYLLGSHIFTIDFALPSRGIYPVPDEIPEWVDADEYGDP